MEIEGSLSLIVYVTSIFGVNCFWVSVYFQVDAYGGHMGEEGKWGICGEDCPVAAESEGGSQYTLYQCTMSPLLTHTAGRIHSVPHVLTRLFIVEEGIAATLARDRLRFTLAVRVRCYKPV